MRPLRAARASGGCAAELDQPQRASSRGGRRALRTPPGRSKRHLRRGTPPEGAAAAHTAAAARKTQGAPQRVAARVPTASPERAQSKQPSWRPPVKVPSTLTATAGTLSREWEKLLGPEGLLPGQRTDSPLWSAPTSRSSSPPGGAEKVSQASPSPQRAQRGAVRRLEQLWEDVGWPQGARAVFRERWLQLPSGGAKADPSMAAEVAERATAEHARIESLRQALSAVLAAVAQRERCLGGAAQELDRVLAPGGAGGQAAAVAAAVRQLRRATVVLCEALREWRALAGGNRPFQWRGHSVAEKVYSDMRTLKAHPAAERLLKPQIFTSPLLYPLEHLHSGAQGTAAPRLARLAAAQHVLDVELGAAPAAAQAPAPAAAHGGAAQTAERDGGDSPRGEVRVVVSGAARSHDEGAQPGTPTLKPQGSAYSIASAGPASGLSQGGPILPSPTSGDGEEPAADAQRCEGGHMQREASRLSVSWRPDADSPLTPVHRRGSLQAPESPRQRRLSAGGSANGALENALERRLSLGQPSADSSPAFGRDMRAEDIWAVERLQRFLRRRMRLGVLGGSVKKLTHQHEDEMQCSLADLEAAERLKRPSTPPPPDVFETAFTPFPVWLRLSGFRGPLRDAGEQRAAAATAVQRSWRAARQGRGEAAARRVARSKQRAASVLLWHWRRRVLRVAASRTVQQHAARRARLAGELAERAAHYAEALARLQRAGRGLRERLRVKRAEWYREQGRRAAAAHIITRAARCRLSRLCMRRRRADADRAHAVARDHSRRDAAARRLQALWRGCAARTATTSHITGDIARKVYTQLDMAERPHPVAQRFVRRWLGRRRGLHPRREMRTAVRERQRLRERQWWGAVLIQTRWRGWRARVVFNNQLARRLRWRRDHIARVGERYRGVHFDQLYIAELAEQANERWRLLSNWANKEYASEQRQRARSEPVSFSPTAERRRRELAADREVWEMMKSPRHRRARDGSPFPTAERLRTPPCSRSPPPAASPVPSLAAAAEWSRLADQPLSPGQMQSPCASSPPSSACHTPTRRRSVRNSVRSAAGSEMSADPPPVALPLPEPEEFFSRQRVKPLECGFARLRLLLLVAQRRAPELLACRALVSSLADFASRSVQVAGTRLCLDLSRVCGPGAQADDDGMQVLTNNLLRLPQPLLLQLLSGVYSEQPGGAPELTERWDIVNVLVRVITEWGLHALNEVFNESVLTEDQSGSTTLMEAVLTDLGMSSAADLSAYLRKDVVQLGYDERLQPATLRGICTELQVARGEEMARRVWEMGLQQVFSVQDDAALLDMLAFAPYDVPPELDREHREQYAVRTLLGL
eukprot:TRINITY_DN23224_c0_g1_i1.p1 TRINITY_DN23224_c0_g1~~TRINITY_DN23224_c0_g1_i1.p1  ORF type:complete len:1331 (+),score=268.37 TRINITY_DN23224_c0_g1_i1:77-4069(+)